MSAIMKKLLSAVIFLTLAALMGGCGYSTHSVASTYFKKIYVEPFKNGIDFTSEFGEGTNIRTYFPLVETNLTTALVDRFLIDGNIKVVKKEDAEVILKGELVGYTRDVLRYDDNNNPLEYRVSLSVNMSLWDVKDNKKVWEESNFTGDASYFISGPSSKSEAAAVNDAVNDLARRIVDRTVEQW
jgi:ABC-type uncharacterized transport system auxiliary subunit